MNETHLHQKTQLDKKEREKVEDVITKMRERVESDIEYQLTEIYKVTSKERAPKNLSPKDKVARGKLIEAIEREATDGYSWEKAFKQYIKATGYTVVNRLAAFRCMEIRGFLDREVTKFREDGVTPAADPIIKEEFADNQEGVFKAYKRACDHLADEIEILFDRSGPYSIILPQFNTFKDLCKMLDKIDDYVWRADDILGWVYEYYNAPDLSEVRRKAREEGLDAEDTTIANQFYTPHWVVRMLTDNSLGKLYLEYKGELLSTIEAQKEFSVEERKNRSPYPSDSPTLKNLCTYLVPTKEEGEATKFEDPSEIRVIDPACGSGHFLLYAFDILERIWHGERADLDRAEIPKLILKHNLYGIDLDLRACQIAAFNLYLKARSRAEREGAKEFKLPKIGIVCADAHITDVEEASDVFEEVAGDRSSVRETLEEILSEFENIHGLGSLLDVKGTLSEKLLKEQTTLFRKWDGDRDLSSLLNKLHKEIKLRKEGGSFLAQDLRSFLRLLVILSQNYDVALMNPPYGSHYGGSGRMPNNVKDYIEEHYEYSPEYYINFFEVCDRVLKKNGRVGMLVPRSFMFKKVFEDFRLDFIGEKGSFDFLAEYGMGVLDNATVNTVGTVVRSGEAKEKSLESEFIRLHDVNTYKKENTFLQATYRDSLEDSIRRRYTRDLSEFEKIPGSPISYWAPLELRSLYGSETVFDADNAGVNKRSLGKVKQGLATGNNDRFVRHFWESNDSYWIPFSKGGEDSWILPRINLAVLWGDGGEEVKRYESSVTRNEKYYFKEAITYNLIKTKSGRRFGYLNEGSIFEVDGPVLVSKKPYWNIIAYSNSYLNTYLMLCQTTGRHWQVGEVSKLPWTNDISGISGLKKSAKSIASLLISLRRHEFNSPYYTGPLILHLLGISDPLYLYREHPHRKLLEDLNLYKPETLDKGTSIAEIKSTVESYWSSLETLIKEKSNEINRKIFNHFDIDEEQQEEILTEIDLRMGEDPRKAELTPEMPDFETLIKRLLLHLVLKIANEDEDGIVPLSNETEEEEPDLQGRIEKKFRDIWGEYAEDRLAEVDRALGNRRPEKEAYPNLRYWLENELFKFHINEFENTPIIWKITTERLVPDPIDEGFAALIDYHQLDAGVFDRIKTRYLEPRKGALREKRNRADGKRNDESLSASERSKAVEEYKRCENALRQIAEFENVIHKLGRTHKRDWDEEDQQLGEKLIPKVREFRKRIKERLKTLDKLVEISDEEWFEDYFSPTFLKRVNENREEWINALHDLEEACQQYSQDASTSVEAHLHDLFPYFEKLVGTTHYGSNGIFFMNYYFKKGKKFLEKGKPRGGLAKLEHLLAELAAETDDDVKLGKEIKELCNELKKHIPSEWWKRALEEVITTGYNPVKKHGVVINIQPLADAKIIPSIVENKVI